MHIIVAPNSFKGSLSAAQAAAAVARGIKRVSGKIKVTGVPLADGGEGTAEALVAAVGGRFHKAAVTGPLGRPVEARYALLKGNKTAVIDMAACAGLPLVPPAKRNPLHTTTYGVGELILRAIRSGCREIILGAGGSATVDGGLGMLQALGFGFFDATGKTLGPGGRELVRIQSIDTAGSPADLKRVAFRVAVDVANPLVGPHGAARVYGPQKGATPAMVAALERGLAHYAKKTKTATGVAVSTLPGAGAAGGLGAGAAAYLGAEIVSGAGLVLERTSLEAKLVDADLVITGEGRLDAQTAFGKAPHALALLCRRHRVPLVCLAGGVEGRTEAMHDAGFTALFSITDGPCAIDVAVRRADDLLGRAAEQVLRLFLSGRQA